MVRKLEGFLLFTLTLAKSDTQPEPIHACNFQKNENFNCLYFIIKTTKFVLNCFDLKWSLNKISRSEKNVLNLWVDSTVKIYFDEVYLVTAFVPSLTACLANSPGNKRRTAVWISRLVMVERLL
jgi:hypothetical protein